MANLKTKIEEKNNFVENMIFKFHWFINMCYNQEGKK